MQQLESELRRHEEEKTQLEEEKGVLLAELEPLREDMVLLQVQLDEDQIEAQREIEALMRSRDALLSAQQNWEDREKDLETQLQKLYTQLDSRQSSTEQNLETESTGLQEALQKCSSLEEEISVLTNWSFDAFQYVKNASKEKEDFPLARLFMTAFDILAKGGIGESKREEMMELFALINREKLFVFAQNVELGYADVETLSYHNVAHACEVVHATFAILTDVITEDKVMDPLSVLSLLIAAIGHDIYHPGCDNMTLAKERVDIKRRYNGQSLAEMLSCEVVLELLRRSGALSGDGEDDVSGLTTSQIAYIEDVVATSILSTDLLKHEENPNKAAAATAAQIVLKSCSNRAQIVPKSCLNRA